MEYTKKRKYYKVILTGMFAETCVPIKEEVHFVKVADNKEALKESKKLVRKKTDSNWRWIIDSVSAPNGKVIYSRKK